MEARSGVQDGVLSAATGGGALRSIGESFQPDLLRGTGNYSVPIDLPTGPNGLRPDLQLRYSTGQGNGPFGIGWQLAGPLSITRGTDDGVPRYTAADPLLFGGDVLVDVGGGRFRPRSDTQFWDIRRDGEGWRIRTKEGLTYRLGTSVQSRISDGERNFGWLCEQQLDQAGNVIDYTYLRDRGQLYLQRVTWGSFSVELAYEPRPDVVRQGRSGFPISTALRCARIERHAARAVPTLCATHELRYRPAAGSELSLLVEVQLVSGEENYPALRFGYREYEPDPRYLQVTSEDGVLPLGRPDTALVDMDGDGLPDVLQTNRSGHRYWKNLGGRFAAARTLPDAPSGLYLGEPGVSFADLTGDGTADLFRADQRISLVARNTGAGRWADAPMIVEEQFPLAVSAATTRLVDLDGDGVSDLLQSGIEGFTLAYNQRGDGWTQPEVVTRIRDLARFPDVDLSDEAIHLADMTGDGLTDIVAVYSGRLCYWPYYGYGRWGEQVEMANPPLLPQGFRRERVLLTDLDGDGTTDLLYVDTDRVLYWLNRSGSGWSAPFEMPFVPPPNVEAMHAVDLLGTGVRGLCWANAGSSGAPARFVDLSGGVKPYLLTSVDNGFGCRTTIEYTTSSAIRVSAGGDAWNTFLPFPVHVVSALIDEDAITGQRTETHLRYERGYFDPVHRVFRGFETVQTRAVGDEYTPTVVQRTTFNLGAMLGPEERYLRTPAERAQDHALSGSTSEVAVFHEQPDGTRTLVSNAVTDWAVREEFADGVRFVYFPHLRHTTATDIAAEAPDRVDEATYDYDQFGNVTRKRRTTRFTGQDPHVSEQQITYALNENAWLVGLPQRLSTRDADGNLLNDKLIRYDGPAFTGLPAGSIDHGVVRRTEELVLADWALPPGYADDIDASWGLTHQGEGWYRVTEAYQHDAHGNVIGQCDSLGRTTTVSYDADGLFPVSATDPSGGLTHAVFDPRTAQPLSIVTPNGNEVRYTYSSLGRLRAQAETTADGSLQLTQYFAVRYAEGAAPAHIISVKPLEPGADADLLDAADLATLPGASVQYTYFDGRGNQLQRARRAARSAGGWVIGGRGIYTRNNLSGAEFPNAIADSPAYQAPAPGGPAVRFRYGPTGQVVRLEHPDGGLFRVDYLLDRVEKRDAETPDAAAPIVEHYNALGQLVGVDTPDGSGAVASTRYEVEHAGRITSIADATGNLSTRYTFAGPGSAIVITNQEAGTRTYYRDAAGNVRLRRDSLGRVLRLDYDAAGRLSAAVDVSDPAHPRTVRELGYADGALVEQVEAGITTSLVNDRLGRAVSKRIDYGDGHQLTITREYGLQNDVRALVYPDGFRAEFAQYDGGQVRGITGILDSVEYDMHDNPLDLDFGAGVHTGYEYDPAMKRLLTMQLRAGATPLRRLAFSYDRNGCITTAVDTVGATTTGRRYSYDAMFRLTRATAFTGGLGGAQQRDDAYSYSLIGDIIANTEGTGLTLHYGDPANPSRITGVERGGVTAPLTHDAGGRLTQLDDIAGIDYDVWDRPVTVRLTDGTTIAFAYDEAGLQVRRELTRPDGSTHVTRAFEALYEEGSDGTRANLYIGKLLVAVRSAGGTRAVLTDHLGSILTTCDATGAGVRHQVYTPFGRPTLAGTADTRYTGVPTDATLALVQMGARWYSPELGRFVTPDWFVLENPTHGQRLPQSLNVYSYAINNPIMLRDPSGKFFGLDDLIVAAVGFVVGFVTGVIVGIAEGRSFGDTLLLGLEAGLCGAAGAWLAYITVGAATAALGALGLGLGSGITTGLTVGAAVVGGLNGVISGSLEIYDWGSATGWLAFLTDSSWGLIGTTFAVLLHGVNLFYGDRNYSFGLSKRQNRHVYDGGFGFGTFAFTQGNVTSNLRNRRTDLVDHETSHIWTSRLFGPIFQTTYIAWMIVGGVVGFLIGIPLAIAGTQSLGQSIEDVGYFDNPWESWAYDIGGTPAGGKLSWT